MNESNKFVKISCIKCKTTISKENLQKDNLISIDGDHFKIKPFYLKCITPSGSIKLNEKKNSLYLYENIKCVSCDCKIGRLIKSATRDNWEIIDRVIFKNKNISM